MTSRYSKREIGVNKTNQYFDVFKEKNISQIRQYLSDTLHHPAPEELEDIETVSHVWKLGDRYYKLAHKYYGDPKLWWIIAWYNKLPTEGHLSISDVIYIPLSLEKIRSVLRI